jgi:Ca2+:H+ antiporter
LKLHAINPNRKLTHIQFTSAVELIVSIIALIQGLITVVQASMLGSILSNLLLVLGMCFFFGGIKYKEQSFNVTAAQTSASLLFIATSSLLLPAAFYGSVYGLSNESKSQVTSEILSISRATSIILLIIYAGFLFFQLKTHKSFVSRILCLRRLQCAITEFFISVLGSS